LSIPWAFPLVLLPKLHEPTDEERALLSSPSPDPAALTRVVAALNQPERAPGRIPIVLLGTLLPEMGVQQFFIPGALPQRLSTARVLVSPIALEVRGPGVFVPVVPKLPPTVAAALGPALGPARAVFRCDDMGIPPGRYGITLVTVRGQTWSLPNELAPIVLAPNVRGAPSQGTHVRIERAPPTAGYVCPTRM
jgi:hypothetical protein